MKNIFAIFSLLSPLMFLSQVIIGTGKTAVTPGASLEFGTEKKGIILPWVTAAANVSGAVNGTIVFDSTVKKVKVLEKGTWFDLTLQTNGLVDTSLQTGKNELTNAKTSIGTPATPSVPGILVLEDSNKAMVLPQVTSYKDITSPSPGMMVFDTTSNYLCLFNGKQWTFWRP